jgi:phosphate transport system substrate-binding protein
MRAWQWRAKLLAASALTLGLLGSAEPARAGGITLTESGSTLLYPLFQLWSADYGGVDPNVTLSGAATGSTAGIQAAISGAARIGASDAYLSDDESEQNPQLLDIPLAIAAQTINYNLPGLNGAGIKLNGPILAGIYGGAITDWDDPAIKAINPGVALPHQTIIPVRRADGSGDTFVFTQFLDFSTQSGDDDTGVGTSVDWPDVVAQKAGPDAMGYGLRVDWPAVAAEKSATGNQGMVAALAATPYSVGYVGVSYQSQIAGANLGTAQIENQNGKFVLPTAETISAAAAVLDPRTPPDERLTLVYAAGDDSYPLINYEYAMVSKTQPDPATAAALRAFLLWAISGDGGNAAKYLSKVNFVPLPDFIRGMSEAQIDEIQ